MALYHPDSVLEGINAEKYNKDILVTNADVVDNSTVTLRPLSADQNSSVLTFRYLGSPHYHTDLSRTYMELECQIVDDAGKTFPPKTIIYPALCLLSSLFSSRKVTMGNETFQTGDNLGYLAFIRDAYSMTVAMKSTLALDTNLYFDTVRNYTHVTEGFRDTETKRFHLYEPLELQPFGVSKLLPPGIPITLEFYRQRDEFVLINNTENSPQKPKIIIHNARLEFTCLELTPKLNLELEKRLNTTPMIYDVKRSEIQTYVIQGGLQKLQTAPLTTGPLPYRVIIFLMEQARYVGTYDSPPYTFSHFDINKISLLNNGHNIEREHEIEFEKGKDFNSNSVKLYYKLHQYLGQNFNNNCGIPYKQFVETLCCFPFDLTPGLNAYDEEAASLVQTGELSVKLNFDKPLKDNIVLMMYSEYFSTFELNSDRHIYLNYS